MGIDIQKELTDCNNWILEQDDDFVTGYGQGNYALGLARLAWQAAKAQAVPEPTLDAPARVGGGIFQKGIKWSTVIGAAQRHYEHELREPIKPIISPADMLRIATGELVLVPIDTLKECLNWSNVARWDSPSKEVDREIAHHEGIIVAIIEAQEPAND